MMLLTISEFIGRFHPVLVHLPIGILLLSVVFYFLSLKNKYQNLIPAVKISLLAGIFAALFSCVTGFLLSKTGDYDGNLVNRHQWFGIGMTVVAGFAYYIMVKKPIYLKWVFPLIALLIFITGHLGGTLTHGEGYLTEALGKKNNTNDVAAKPIKDVQQAVAYTDIIQPILQSKCYTCHAANKQKGKLRLDEPDFILKGGEDGKAVIPGSAGESEMIKRILLPMDNKEHMPPKEKSQLSKTQMELLSWWINSGADFNKQVAALKQPKEIMPYLGALQSGGTQHNQTAVSDIPATPVEKAPDSIIQKLKMLDVAVNKVAANSNYVTVNFVAVDSITTKHLQLLNSLSKQVVWLKMGDAKLNEEVCVAIGNLPNLTRLFLNGTNITNNQLTQLNKLSQLQYLNLAQTKVTAEGIKNLNGLKNIKQLYLYQTAISSDDYGLLKKNFPQALIDTGGYKLEFIPSDTMRAKPKNQNQ
jgi:uncharacterized membrane protein/mono/diheme cytochrome c family protein